VSKDSRNCNVATDRTLVALKGILVVVAIQEAVLVSPRRTPTDEAANGNLKLWLVGEAVVGGQLASTCRGPRIELRTRVCFHPLAKEDLPTSSDRYDAEDHCEVEQQSSCTDTRFKTHSQNFEAVA
jgi:hypothetical protein